MGVALAAALLVLIGPLAEPAGERPRPPGESELLALLARAADYVVGYGREFREILAEERYLQVQRVRVAPPGTLDGLQQRRLERTLRSDIVYVSLPGSLPWGTFRDTFSVDGKPCRDREPRLEILLARPDATSLAKAQALMHESSRFNLGKASRNYNVPLLALLFLLPENQPRFTFAVEERKRASGTDAVVLAYHETTVPSLLRDFERDDDLPVRGRFLVETASGRVLRSEMRLRYRGQVDAETAVDFRFVEKLGLWAPARMTESWSGLELIEGQAHYSNYRRFETGVGPIEYIRE